MKDDRDRGTLWPVTLDDETVAHYEQKAHAAGRPLEEQLLYELSVAHGLTVPDPGDADATHWRQLVRRMETRRILQG